MKTKAGLILFLLFLCVSLTACGAGQTPSSAGSTAGSSQTAYPADSGSSGSTSPEEAGSPTDLYQSVLENKSRFFSADDGREFLLQDFLKRNSQFEGVYQVTQFAVLDMDQDQLPEIVLELSLHDSPEQYEILHAGDGTVYGYNFTVRGFEMLKADGTYQYANGASDLGIQKIRSFLPNAADEETLGSVQSGSAGNGELSYSVGNASAEKDAFDALLNRQNEKADAKWYAFSTENIEGTLIQDGGAASSDEADQKAYFGSWTVKKVLAYGIGTYSSEQAENLVGKKLSFSKDSADVFTDEPSEAPVAIRRPEYQETTEQRDAFQADYQMSFEKLGIRADSVTEVQISGSDGTSGTFFVKDSSTLILLAGGTYFELSNR